MIMLSKVHHELERMLNARERAFHIQREIVPLCAQAIRDIQKEKYGLAEKNLKRIRKLIKRVELLLKDYPDILYNILGSGYQEYAELSIFLSYVKKRKLPKLDVPPRYYILGLGDAIGELKREGMSLLSRHKLKEAERLKEELEDLYYEFSKKTYPNSLVPGLKPKQDAMRRVLNDYNDSIHSHKLTRS
jgi:translin